MTRRTTTIKRALLFWGFVVLGSLLVYVYPIVRLSQWSQLFDASGWPFFILFWASTVIALRVAFTGSSPVLREVMVNWMGAGLILACVCLIYEILRLLLPITDLAASRGILTLTTGLVLFAVFVANRFVHRSINIDSNKLDRDYLIVQLSDVHVGSRSPRFLRKLVNQVNKLKADYVVITGDLVDSSRVGHRELQALADIHAPTLFTVGNHDRYVGLDRLIPILEQLGVKVLRNTTHTVDNHDLEFIAIDDAEADNHVADTLPAIAGDAHRFRILLYHRPMGFEAVVDAGIELMLSGHTHHGQIFPFGWLVRQQFSRHKGLHRETGKHGLSQLYVSPGTGTWGPTMRLGTHNEITSIYLKQTGST